MSSINWLALMTFLLITALTPGPNNLSCLSMGVKHGYRSSLVYIGGIVAGIMSQSMISGLISASLLKAFPLYEAVLRVAGAGYVLWLAFQTLRSSYTCEDHGGQQLRMKDGFLLQFLNIKAILFVLTIYTAYLTPVLDSVWLITLAAAALGVRSFVVNSVWALFGAGIRRWLSHPVAAQTFNIAVALMLAWNAVDLLGLPKLLFG